MANRKISELGALTAPAADDLIPVVDVSEGLNANKNKKITYGEFLRSLPDGTEGAPAVAFDSALTTGLYKSAANELSIATNGGRAIQIEANNKTTIYGDLVVTGGTTTVSSTTITVADKNIELGTTGSPSDAGATGGGLTLKATTDKTWTWIDSTDSWTSNQNLDIVSGMVYKIQGTQVLSATALGAAVVGSSLTSVGTLTGLTVSGAINANGGIVGNITGNITGNAATATALQNARDIGGVSFNGTANINLPGVNTAGNQNTSGNAATATILATARTIGGVSFNGSANINLPGVNAAGNQNTSGTSAGLTGTPAITVAAVTAASLDISGDADIDGTLEADAYTVNGTALNEFIADTVGAMVSSNTETNIAVTYEDSDNTLDFVIGTLNQDTTGNAATATALQTARTIGGVSFNGTANISLPGVNQTGNQNTTGSAATLTTARTIGGVSFDGSANINLPGVNAAGNQNTSGTAAALQTARTINGVSFDGTANITVTAAAASLTGTALNGTVTDSLLTSVGTLGSLAVTNAITAGSLDIAGGVDVDGTLEADAITVDGTALNEFIADTVGAMVSSNTETNITVTYQDADNTLDFVIGTLNQNTTGSAATLTTARTIGGVSFNGSANIDLPGVNAAGNQNTTGSAATLTTARTIGGVAFDGSANINLPGVNATGSQNTTGTAAQADILSTSRTIGGVSFNGSANIDLPGVNAAGNQNTTGNAATATALATARTIGGTSFDGTANITPANATNAVNLSGTLASGVTGTTQSTSDNSTKIATTAYVTSAVSNLIDSAPGALDTLNELAAAIGDDANFSTTITNSLATKLPLAGGTMTGAINLGSNNITNGGTITGTFVGGITGNVTGNTSGSSGSCTGNAATATALATARAINGVNFDGTAAITVTAAAGTLSGNTLASGVTASSLTSVGTLTGLTVSGNALFTSTGCIRVSAGTTAQRPGSPAVGDFRYNSTEAEFEGYTASGWGAIAGGGGGGTDFRYLALRNAANNGAASYPAADFTLVTEGTTNALTPSAANALLVSYGGVLQQPNTGTSTPTTGFALSGSTIKFGSNIASAPDFIIYQLGAGIGTPSDDTVTSAKIVDGAIVNADINASAAIALSKLATGALPSGITVASANITDGTIVNADVNASAAIALSKLATGLLPSGITINADNIVDGTVVAADIAANAITASELADDAVDTDAILNNAVTGAKIAMGSDAAGDILYYNGTDYVRLPVGTAGQSLKVNSGASAPEWGTAAAGAKGGGTENIFWENEATMNNSYTISTNYNAGVFGPLTVASGATITVPSGSVLSIV